MSLHWTDVAGIPGRAKVDVSSDLLTQVLRLPGGWKIIGVGEAEVGASIRFTLAGDDLQAPVDGKCAVVDLTFRDMGRCSHCGERQVLMESIRVIRDPEKGVDV